jgi:hypothetical protein
MPGLDFCEPSGPEENPSTHAGYEGAACSPAAGVAGPVYTVRISLPAHSQKCNKGVHSFFGTFFHQPMPGAL